MKNNKKKSSELEPLFGRCQLHCHAHWQYQNQARDKFLEVGRDDKVDRRPQMFRQVAVIDHLWLEGVTVNA